MSVAIINDEADRRRVTEYLARAPIGTRVQFTRPLRTLPQNARMHAMLTDIVAQKKTVNGRAFSTDEWKTMFLQALGVELQVLPTLDGQGFFSTTFSSSKLEVQQMSDLIEFMFAWGAENGVVWSDPQSRALEQAYKERR